MRLLPGSIIVFLVAFAARLSAIVRMSPMPSGDSYDRLAHTDRLVVHDWLPLYQALLDVEAFVTRDLGALRACNAVVGSFAAVAFAALIAGELGGWFGLVGGLALALSPVHVGAAAGLYQEPLFIAFVCLCLATLERRPNTAIACIAAATLCRYEGWILAALVLPRLRARGLALLVWPAAWVTWRALAGGDAGWLDVSFAPARLVEQARILRGLSPYWVGWPTVGAALVGLVIGRRAKTGDLLVAFVALDLVFVTIFHPFSPPDNARQLHLPVLGAILLALRAAARIPRVAIGLPIAVAALLAPIAGRGELGWQAADGPVSRGAAQGEALRREIGPGERVLVVEPGVTRHAGEEPSGCLAVMAYAALPRDRVICDAEDDGSMRWVANVGAEGRLERRGP